MQFKIDHRKSFSYNFKKISSSSLFCLWLFSIRLILVLPEWAAPSRIEGTGGRALLPLWGGLRGNYLPSNVTAKIVHSHVELNPSLDLTNELVRPLLFTKSCNLPNQIEFSIVKYFKRAGIGSLNHGITLNRDSLNQDLSILE